MRNSYLKTRLARLLVGAGALTVSANLLIVPTSQANPAGGNNGSADPALQQVVKDEEAIDLEKPVTINRKHVDLGPRIINGKWQLLARDDTAAPPTWRSADRIVFKMNSAAQQKVPAGDEYAFTGISGGGTAWVIPQTEKQDVPWLGWSTQSPAVVNAVNGQVKYTFEGHQGPGKLTVFTQDGNFSAPKLLWTSDKKEAQVLNVDLNTHTHVNWVFTEPGVHLVRLSVSATLKDGAEVSDTRVLRFAIGDNTKAQAALDQQWKGGQTPASAKAASTASDPSENRDSSLNTLVYVGVGLLIFAVIGGVAAVVILKRSAGAKVAAQQSYQQSKQTP